MVEISDIYDIGTYGNYFSSYNKNLGNKLFIYSCSRIISDLLNYDLICPENSLIRRENQETKKKDYLDVFILKVELFTFKEGLHFFSIEVSIKQNELCYYSDLTFAINKFNSKVINNGAETNWVNWIEENCLARIKIASTEKLNVKVDDYSGSKFKLFTVLDLADSIDVNTREELLYDIGCGAKIGSAGGTEYFSPSQDYYKSLLKNKISVFNNYTILTLFDTVTVIGNKIIDSNLDSYKRKTWSQSYFRIVLYNFYIILNCKKIRKAMKLN